MDTMTMEIPSTSMRSLPCSHDKISLGHGLTLLRTRQICSFAHWPEYLSPLLGPPPDHLPGLRVARVWSRSNSAQPLSEPTECHHVATLLEICVERSRASVTKALGRGGELDPAFWGDLPNLGGAAVSSPCFLASTVEQSTACWCARLRTP
jgi:hypothetical protein